MSNLLSTAKKLLIQQAIEFYQSFEKELPLDKNRYATHYANLGEIIFEIESIQSFSEFCAKVENVDFLRIGLVSMDDFEIFLERVMDCR